MGLKSNFSRKFWVMAAVFAGMFAYCIVRALHGGDFDVFLQAGAKMLRHENIYQGPFVRDLQFYNGPVFALLLAPFSLMPKWIPEFLWLIASTFFLVRTWKLIEGFLSIKQITARKYTLWWALSFILISRLLVDNYNMIQLTFFLLWASFESLNCMARRQHIRGGLLLAFAINVKLLPLVFLPYLLYRKEWKGFLYTVLFTVGYLFVPVIFYGPSYNSMLIHQWWLTINPLSPQNTIEAGNGIHSLEAFLPVFLTDTKGVFGTGRNFVNLPYEQVSLIVNGVRLLLIGLTLFFLGTLPFRKSPHGAHALREISYLCLVTPLLFPHQQKYEFIYMLPAVGFIIFWLLSVKQRAEGKPVNFTTVLVLFIIAVIFSVPVGRDLVGKHLFALFQYYRLLTMGTIMLIPTLAFCDPRALQVREAPRTA